MRVGGTAYRVKETPFLPPSAWRSRVNGAGGGEKTTGWSLQRNVSAAPRAIADFSGVAGAQDTERFFKRMTARAASTRAPAATRTKAAGPCRRLGGMPS